VKHLFFFLALSLSLNTAFAQVVKTFKGNIAYVMAVDGVPLRQTADTKAAKLETLRNGQELQILSGPLASLTVDGIKGNWRKAKVGFKEGFVFDGFLSDLPPGIESWSEMYGIEANTTTSAGSLSSLAGTEQSENVQITRFSNGVTLKEGLMPHFHRREITFKNRSIEEVFVWLRGGLLVGLLNNYRLSDAKIVKKDAKGKITQVLITYEQEEFYLKISYKGNDVLVDLETMLVGGE
jgi:hypothetical protein